MKKLNKEQLAQVLITLQGQLDVLENTLQKFEDATIVVPSDDVEGMVEFVRKDIERNNIFNKKSIVSPKALLKLHKWFTERCKTKNCAVTYVLTRLWGIMYSYKTQFRTFTEFREFMTQPLY